MADSEFLTARWSAERYPFDGRKKLRALVRRSLPLGVLGCIAAACGGSDKQASNEPHLIASGGADGAIGDGSGWSDGKAPGDASADGAPDTASGGAAGTSAAGASAGGSGGSTPSCPTIRVTSAIYASNCGAPTSIGSVATQCNGKTSCGYTMDYSVDPGSDPAFGCAKDLSIAYDCVTSDGVASQKTAYVPPEAGSGSVVTLDCGPCP
jgi:hypothetical protein